LRRTDVCQGLCFESLGYPWESPFSSRAVGGAAASLGRLSGSHAVTLNFVSLDLSAATLTDAITLFYRVEGSSIEGQTLFGTGGSASQRFTLSTELGPLSVQGGASFSSKTFTFGNLVLSGRFEGVALMVAGLTSNVGSVQTRSTGSGPPCGSPGTSRTSGGSPLSLASAPRRSAR